MIFAAINWLSLSITLLLVVFVAVCLLMALLVLMQRPKQEGLGAAFGGGVTDQVFGARTTNVLQKGTVILGSLFFLLSITLAVLIGKQNKQKSLLAPEKPVAAVIEEQAAPAVITPEKPASLVGELPTEETPAPETTPTEETPAPPATEEAPTPPTTEEAPAPPTTEEAPAQPAPQENTGDKTE